MIIGLGHPRSGTAFTVDLLQQSGLDVRHEHIGKDGIVSWEIASLRSEVPWGDAVTSFSESDKIFLVARSPLAMLDSVIQENNQIRSVGFRNSVIYEKFGVDFLSSKIQLTPEHIYDFMSWSVISMIYWYELCFMHNPQITYRVDVPSDDFLLSDFLGVKVDRTGKDLHRNLKGFKFNIPYIGKLSDQPESNLLKMAALAEKLGYPEDAFQIKEMLNNR